MARKTRTHNRWRIPKEVARHVLARDVHCIYFGADFVSGPPGRGSEAPWEHIVNDVRLSNVANIARCCRSCNASKGAKVLSDWLHSKYCRQRHITAHSISTVAQATLAEGRHPLPLEVVSQTP